MWVWSLGKEDPLEKEMATHSSTLAWEIPWTEESGGLQSRGCKEPDMIWRLTTYSIICLSLLLLSVLVASNGKNHYQIQWYEDFPPIFSSKSLIVLGLTLIFLIHFELVLCKFFFFLHMDIQFSQHHLLKRLSCPHCVVLAPLQKLTWPYTWGFIYGIFILFHWLICLSAFQSHTALITVVCNMTWNQELWGLQLYFFPFSRLLWLFWVLSNSI